MNQFLITTSLVTENPPKKVKDCSVVVACLWLGTADTHHAFSSISWAQTTWKSACLRFAFDLSPSNTVTIFVNPALFCETMKQLSNPGYIKLCGDGTFRLILGDWVLMNLGVLTKHYAPVSGAHTFRFTFSPLRYRKQSLLQGFVRRCFALRPCLPRYWFAPACVPISWRLACGRGRSQAAVLPYLGASRWFRSLHWCSCPLSPSCQRRWHSPNLQVRLSTSYEEACIGPTVASISRLLGLCFALLPLLLSFFMPSSNAWSIACLRMVPPNHPFYLGFSITNHPFWGVSLSVFPSTHPTSKSFGHVLGGWTGAP